MMMTFVFVATHAISGFILKGPFLHVGLCMALSLAATIQGVGLAVLLRRAVGKIGFGRIILSWMRILLATAPMAFAVHGISGLGVWQDGGGAILNIAVLALAVVTGVAVFGAAALLFRTPELKELIEAFKKRRRP